MLSWQRDKPVGELYDFQLRSRTEMGLYRLRDIQMLEKVPTEVEWLSWVYAGTAALLIFFTVPFARAAQAIVVNYVGREFFLYTVAFAGIAAGYAAFANLKKSLSRGLHAI